MSETTTPVLRYRSFGVTFPTEQGDVEAVRGLDLDLFPGEVLALVGESGSGKTVTSLAALGLLPASARVRGTVELNGRNVLDLRGEQLRRLRGDEASMVFQEPMTALNPLVRVGRQVAEVLTNHTELSRDAAATRAVELLRQVDIPEPERRAAYFPHELSGGQRQRVMIAMALACNPDVIVADEPTTALDVTVQAGVLELLRDLRRDHGVAILMVTHNMGVVADIADRVAVMYRGDLVETGTARSVLLEPAHEYTRSLLGAVPVLPRLEVDVPSSRGEQSDDGHPKPDRVETPALRLDQVVVEFGARGKRFTAVDGVDLRIHAGEFVGLVGESGSGKSTIGRCALGLVRPSAGTVRLFGADPASFRGRAARAARRRLGVILQDPAASLDPRMSVGDSIAEPMVVHHTHRRRERAARVAELLESVHLPASTAARYPHELSGGQRQRVSLARALALDPELLIADEPTSALDVSVQASVLAVLAELQERYAFGCLFISHDLAVVDSLTHRVAVMYAGRIVEQGPTRRVLTAPRDPYTHRLLTAAPVPDPVEQQDRRQAWLAAHRAPAA
ncbi:dipeptide ABC transporter ATP-binding protein [Phytoactinopolyspora mesophila]|uniref:Dipeptide ABC transporter ATP-binding protein n=1 Tax=Phytoactinopolyspora mesophila TaxID=2650750 RepID=A0A7K3M2X5_9ACTN|nr:ABC transporter ATP-binding protein [Phytoactinopolyspora mesophila]NDL56788.1 dipeptide ABC transporter ATP-binding protein [Phytoactinopolyspora mesophila]